MGANGTNNFGIRDNHSRGKVADFIKKKIAAGSQLSVVSAYFTIYAYEALSAEPDQIGQLHFLFGEPRFIASLDPDKTDKKSFKIEDEGLELANRLQQKEIARRCATWIRDKVVGLKPDLQRFAHKYRQERNTTLASRNRLAYI